jgi:hypothetical protein
MGIAVAAVVVQLCGVPDIERSSGFRLVLGSIAR